MISGVIQQSFGEQNPVQSCLKTMVPGHDWLPMLVISSHLFTLARQALVPRLLSLSFFLSHAHEIAF